MAKNSKLIIGIIVVVAIVVAGFFVISSGDESRVSSNTEEGNVVNGNTAGSSETSENEVGGDEEELPVWMTTELKDVRTGETFRLSDFKGKPVLFESFAVWCPVCTAQQDVVLDLHEEVGDDIISVSLDTDPNEDEERVREHVERNGFTWYYAISPVDNTKALIDEFGTLIVNAPSVPMVLICEDQSFRQLKGFGLKSVEKLRAEVANGCN